MDSTRASAIRLFASRRSTVLPPGHATSRRCDARPSYYSEEPGRRALRARDLVEGGRELDPSTRERAEVRQALQDDHPRAADHAVHREVLGREVGQTRAVLLEEVEADGLRSPGDEPLRRLRREPGRLDEVVGPPAVHPVGPVGAKQDDVAPPHVVGAAAPEIVDRDPVVRADEGEVDDDRLAHHLVEGDLRRGDPILEDVQGRVDVGPRVQALPHARDLPEAWAAEVGRYLEPQGGGWRGERALITGP